MLISSGPQLWTGCHCCVLGDFTGSHQSSGPEFQGTAPCSSTVRLPGTQFCHAERMGAASADAMTCRSSVVCEVARRCVACCPLLRFAIAGIEAGELHDAAAPYQCGRPSPRRSCAADGGGHAGADHSGCPALLCAGRQVITFKAMSCTDYLLRDTGLQSVAASCSHQCGHCKRLP